MDLSTQSKPKPKNQLFWIVVLIIVDILIIGGGVWYLISSNQSAKIQPATTPSVTENSTATTTTTIKNDSDLQSAGTDLDSIDLGSIDTTLGQNDTDMSQF
jgi:flagellar basal body-associated protein FliL